MSLLSFCYAPYLRRPAFFFSRLESPVWCCSTEGGRVKLSPLRCLPMDSSLQTSRPETLGLAYLNFLVLASVGRGLFGCAAVCRRRQTLIPSNLISFPPMATKKFTDDPPDVPRIRREGRSTPLRLWAYKRTEHMSRDEGISSSPERQGTMNRRIAPRANNKISGRP
jgi:hypothetical protein